ncbi:MAG: hypothetical protein AAF063_36865, partial [Cyanobacteria bacterium J06643_5]
VGLGTQMIIFLQTIYICAVTQHCIVNILNLRAMTTSRLYLLLDETLPDEQIIQDLSDRIWNDKELKGINIELNDQWKFVPENTPISIVTKALFKEYYDIPFGTYKVMVAIGGITSQKHGILKAKYCFATLYYNDDCQICSIDFHEEMR